MVRNRVENLVRNVKRHTIFSGRTFKGSFSFRTLNPALQVIGHAAAYELRKHQRFESYGPWSHATGQHVQ